MWQLVYCENLQKKHFIIIIMIMKNSNMIIVVFFQGLDFYQWQMKLISYRRNALGPGVDQIATFHEQHHFQHWNPASNAALLKSSDVPTRAIKTRYIKKLYQIHRIDFLKKIIKYFFWTVLLKRIRIFFYLSLGRCAKWKGWIWDIGKWLCNFAMDLL